MSPENKIASENKVNSYTRVVLDLLSPSSFGLIIYGTFYILIILIAQNSGAKKFILDINLGQIRSTFIGQYIDDLTKLLKLPFANTVTIYIFWAIIASFIYFIGYKMYKNAHELGRDMKLRNYLRPAGTNKNKPVMEFLEKLVFRLFAFILLMIYIYRLVPGGINYLKSTNLNFTLSVGYLGLFLKVLIIEVIVLHFGVILLRLFLLRRRIIYSEKY
jgi:hypothetical protein